MPTPTSTARALGPPAPSPASSEKSNPSGGRPYVVPPDLKEMVINAAAPGDIDVKLRNKLYQAI
eukprot:1572723-Alexandrium_andersonii.AAC.1